MAEPRANSGRRILLVEDDAALAGSLTRLLQRSGYEVFLAVHGRAAIDFVTRQRVDLIISDLFRPEADGIELINFLRRLTPHPPLLAMSGAGKGRIANMLQVAGALGAARLLEKPFTTEQLLSLVGELIGPPAAT